MVPWIEREELVSYDEIDKAVESYKNDLMEHCMTMTELGLDCEYIRFLSGCIHALKQLKRNHTKEWETSIPQTLSSVEGHYNKTDYIKQLTSKLSKGF